MAATARLGGLEGKRHSRSPSCGLRLDGASGRGAEAPSTALSPNHSMGQVSDRGPKGRPAHIQLWIELCGPHSPATGAQQHRTVTDVSRIIFEST